MLEIKVDHAANQYDKGEAVMPINVDQALRKAEKHRKAGDASAARTLYQSVLDTFPGNKRALSGLHSLQVSQQPEQSQAKLRSDVAELAKLHEEKKSEAVIELADVLIKKYPEVSPIFQMKGAAHQRIGHPKEAAASFKLATQHAPQDPNAFLNLGASLKNLNDKEGAIEAFSQASKLRPDHPKVHLELAALFASLQRDQETVDSYRAAIEITPDHAGCHLNLGNALFRLERPKEAAEAYAKSIELSPNDASAHYNFGLVLQQLSQPQEAAKAYRNAIKLKPDYVEAVANLGAIYQELGQDDLVEETLRKALQLQPDNKLVHFNLCELLDRTGQVDKFGKAVDEAVTQLGRDEPLLQLPLATLAHREDRFADARDILEAMPQDDNPDIHKRSLEILGKVYDKLGQFDKAFAQYQAHNDTTAASPENAHNEPDYYFNRLQQNRLSWESTAKVDFSTPVPETTGPNLAFLIGFPRSGTTLLDTILRGHPEIEVLEELKMTANMVTKLGKVATVDVVNALTAEHLVELRQTYIDELGAQTGDLSDKKLIIDKLPLNIVEVGLINRIFPDAKFILALRHPCDCVLSCFMQAFKLNQAMVNFLELERSAHLYDTVMALWSAFNEKLDLSSYQIRYEDVIEDIPGTCAPLLNYLGLEWIEEQTDYQKTALGRGRIKTPSYNQVTKPIYKQARGRWENYRTQMAPVLPILLPWAEKFGYGSE